MVAESPRPRIFAVLLALAFLTTALVPLASAQIAERLPVDVEVVRGSVTFVTSSASYPNLAYDETATMSVEVKNKGQGRGVNMPVFYYLTPEIKGCKAVTLEPVDETGATKSVKFQIRPFNIPSGGHAVAILANEPWPSDWGTAPTCPSGTETHFEDATATTPEHEEEHLAWGYFLLNHTIDLTIPQLRWCSGSDAQLGCDKDMMENGGKWNYNVTGYPEDDPQRSTRFVVDILNTGTHTNMTDYGHADCESELQSNGTGSWWKVNPETCGDFRYDVQLRLSRPDDSEGQVIRLQHETDYAAVFDGTIGEETVAQYERFSKDSTLWFSDDWSLNGRKGAYKAVVNIDPAGNQIQEHSKINNQKSLPIEVRAVDFTANLTSGFRTGIDNPYPFAANTLVSGKVTFENLGKANATHEDRDVNISIFVDEGKHAYTTTLANGILQGSKVVVDYSFRFSNDPDEATYLSPGKHTLYAEIDEDHSNYEGYRGAYNEHDETNNIDSLVFYIEDNSAPTFRAIDGTDNPLLRNQFNSTEPNIGSGSSDELLRPFEAAWVRAWVDDADSEVTVVANFTYDDDENISREYPMRLIEAAGYYTTHVHDLDMHDPANETRAEQNWTLRVVATDATGNEKVSAPRPVTLRKWDIHFASEPYVVLGQEQNRTIGWSDSAFPYYRVRLLDNMTGIRDQWNHSENLKLIIDPPGDDVIGRPYEQVGPGFWSNEEHFCGYNDDEDPSDDLTKDRLPDSTIVDCPNYGQQVTTFYKSDPGRPGVWNATVVISDASGAEVRFNRTFIVLDELPQFREFKLTNLTSAPIARVAAGTAFNATVSIRDDFDVNTSSVHVNFTRSDGVWRNITLESHESIAEGDAKRYWFNETIPTGRGTELDLAGTFNVTVEAVDVNGNWGKSSNLTFVIEDATEPTLAAGVLPPEQETGENVTFWAESTDQTKVIVRLQVTRNGAEVYNATLDHVEGDRYEHVTNFTETGTYEWTMIAFDGNVAPLSSAVRSGILRVSDNLGPRFEIRSPSFSVDGVRYSNAAPRLEVVVYDSDGVDASELRLTVDGVDVELAASHLQPAPTGFNGYTIVYPLSQNYEHNDTVVVLLNATDLSNRTLSNDVGFSFRVDDSTPVSRMVSFEPRFRALEDHTWNVSLDTEFTISATDNDGMPTDVEAIRFQVIGGGSSTTETVYSGPFKLRDIPNAYTGPRIYIIQFFAEDDVGNRERPAKTLNLYVDDTPPQLDPFGSLPQGRYVNATFVDDRSGVERAVAWYKVNDAPYKPHALERDGDVWRGVLPEGKKGDQVSYFLEAWDRVGNSETAGNESAPYSSYTVGNHLPIVRITSPVLGASVSRDVTVRWTATDEDGDPLSFKVSLKAPGRPNFVELVTLEGGDALSHTIDSTQFPDGQYVLAVTASDGTFVARAESTVLFINSGRAIERVSVPSERVSPEEGVLITAQISKAQAVVEARVYRSGEFVEAFALNDEGREGDEIANDGTYSVRASFARSGSYSVEIVTRYQENGEAKEDRMMDAASFTVSLTPGAIITEYWMVWMGLVTLALAAVGVAGYGLYKKWR